VQVKKNIFKNRNGFGVVETLIGVGISAILITVLIGIMKMGGDQKKRVDQSFQVNSWFHEINQIFQEEIACTATMTNTAHVAADGQVVTQLFLAPAVAHEIQAGLILSKTELVSMTLVGPPVNLAASRVRLNLEVTISKGGKIVKKFVPFIAEVDGSMVIQKCFGLYDKILFLENICSSLGGTLVDLGPGLNCNMVTAGQTVSIDLSNYKVALDGTGLPGSIGFIELASQMREHICRRATELLPGTSPHCNYLSFGSDKTEADCTAAGGFLYTVALGVTSAYQRKICRFDEAVCPAGWSQHENFTETQFSTCAPGEGCAATPLITTGQHLFDNLLVEVVARPKCEDSVSEVICGTTAGKINSCIHPINEFDTPCVATVLEIGCR
jgi:hypothetical protein